jgi:hypothetical protein
MRAASGAAVGLFLIGQAAVVAPVQARQAVGTAAQPPAPVVRMFGTLQVQFNTTSVDPSEVAGTAPLAPSTFEIRRVRLGAEVRFPGGWTARLEPELAMGRAQMRNAWIENAVADGWTIRAGQFKKPFGLVQLTSSTAVPTIERAVRIRGLAAAQAQADTMAGGAVLSRLRGRVLLGEQQDLLDGLGYHGYDIGAAVYGTRGPFRLQAGLFNGQGADQLDETGRKSAAARVLYRLPLPVPVTLGGATSFRELTTTATAGAPALAGWAHSVELEVGAPRRPGANLLAELVTGENLGTGGRFMAAQGIASWYAALDGGRYEGVEMVGRVSWGDPRREVAGDDGLLLTPGVNLWMSGRNRLMLNWDVFLPGGGQFARHGALRAQAQINY